MLVRIVGVGWGAEEGVVEWGEPSTVDMSGRVGGVCKPCLVRTGQGARQRSCDEIASLGWYFLKTRVWGLFSQNL